MDVQYPVYQLLPTPNYIVSFVWHPLLKAIASFLLYFAPHLTPLIPTPILFRSNFSKGKLKSSYFNFYQEWISPHPSAPELLGIQSVLRFIAAWVSNGYWVVSPQPYITARYNFNLSGREQIPRKGKRQVSHWQFYMHKGCKATTYASTKEFEKHVENMFSYC